MRHLPTILISLLLPAIALAQLPPMPSTAGVPPAPQVAPPSPVVAVTDDDGNAVMFSDGTSHTNHPVRVEEYPSLLVVTVEERDAQAVADISRIDAMATSVSNYSASIKFCICLTIPPNASQDAFASSYKEGKPSWRQKRNMIRYADALNSEYAGREGENIYVVPINTAIDTVNNFNDSVHPDSSGYQQMADAIWAFINNN